MRFFYSRTLVYATNGGGWLTFRDLSLIGAGQYKALQYAIPDLLKDGLIDEFQITRKGGSIKKTYNIYHQDFTASPELEKTTRVGTKLPSSLP